MRFSQIPFGHQNFNRQTLSIQQTVQISFAYRSISKNNQIHNDHNNITTK